MKTISILDKTYICASEWDRLTPEQAVIISGAMQHFMKHSAQPDADIEDLHSNLRWHVSLALLGITVQKFIQIREKLIQKQGETSAIEQLASLITRISEPILESEKPLTRNHIPMLDWPIISTNKFIGPNNLLQNLTIEEFAFADSMFMKHWQSPTEDYIDGLIAILWRLKDPTADARSREQRIPFQKHTFIEDAKIFTSLPVGTKHYIFLFYKGCRTRIEQTFTHVFSPGSGSAQKTDTSAQWTKVIASMTEKVTDLESMRKTNLWDFIGHMDGQIAQNQKRERDAAIRKK